MQYRRFGKTEKRLSVITLGGMRYVGGWTKPRENPHREMVQQCKRTVLLALEHGINHIETAYGYGKSEHCYGQAFEELGLDRRRFYLMTKGSAKTGDEMRRIVEEQLRGLRTERIDLYGYHGINSQQTLRNITQRGGPIDVLLDYQQKGVIGDLGFSTHAPVEVICRAIETDLFAFVNLHYYYFFQRNFAAIQLACARDMGVFIISPNDKGGHLFKPPPLLSELTHPLSPLQFNARFCLRRPEVHTLSFGLTQASQFEQIAGIFPASTPLSQEDLAIQHKLDARLGVDPKSAYDGYELQSDPSGINIPEVLRLRRMYKCYDMLEFARYRYNMFEEKGDWHPGCFATDDAIALLDETRVPADVPLREMLSEAHRALYVPRRRDGAG